MIDNIVSGGIGLGVGVIASFLIKEAYLERKINRLEDENESMDEELATLRNRARGIANTEVKQQKEGRYQQAMMEAVMEIKGGKSPLDIIQALAVKYPDIALDLAKKGM